MCTFALLRSEQFFGAPVECLFQHVLFAVLELVDCAVLACVMCSFSLWYVRFLLVLCAAF